MQRAWRRLKFFSSNSKWVSLFCLLSFSVKELLGHVPGKEKPKKIDPNAPEEESDDDGEKMDQN